VVSDSLSPRIALLRSNWLADRCLSNFAIGLQGVRFDPLSEVDSLLILGCGTERFDPE
jgi:hypothetical protein